MLSDMASSMSASVGVGILCQKSRGGHYLAGMAVTALGDFLLNPRLLHRVTPVGGKPLDRGDLLSLSHPKREFGRTGPLLRPHARYTRRKRAMPQPYFVPVRPSSSRITHKSGVSGWTATVYSLRLTLSFTCGKSLDQFSLSWIPPSFHLLCNVVQDSELISGQSPSPFNCD